MDIELAVLVVRIIGVVVLPGVVGHGLYRLLFCPDSDDDPHIFWTVAAALALCVCALVPRVPTTGFTCFG